MARGDIAFVSVIFWVGEYNLWVEVHIKVGEADNINYEPHSVELAINNNFCLFYILNRLLNELWANEASILCCCPHSFIKLIPCITVDPVAYHNEEYWEQQILNFSRKEYYILASNISLVINIGDSDAQKGQVSGNTY